MFHCIGPHTPLCLKAFFLVSECLTRAMSVIVGSSNVCVCLFLSVFLIFCLSSCLFSVKKETTFFFIFFFFSLCELKRVSQSFVPIEILKRLYPPPPSCCEFDLANCLDVLCIARAVCVFIQSFHIAL